MQHNAYESDGSPPRGPLRLPEDDSRTALWLLVAYALFLGCLGVVAVLSLIMWLW